MRHFTVSSCCLIDSFCMPRKAQELQKCPTFLNRKKKTSLLPKFNVFGPLYLSPSILSRTIKILEHRLLRSLYYVYKNTELKEICKIFPQLKRYKFLWPCFIKGINIVNINAVMSCNFAMLHRPCKFFFFDYSTLQLF